MEKIKLIFSVLFNTASILKLNWQEGRQVIVEVSNIDKKELKQVATLLLRDVYNLQ